MDACALSEGHSPAAALHITQESLGNPMMDEVQPRCSTFFPALRAVLRPFTHRVLLLPGTRMPELHHNWHVLLAAAHAVAASASASATGVAFVAPLPPNATRSRMVGALEAAGWVADPCEENTSGATATYRQRGGGGALLVLVTAEGAYTDCVHCVHAAIAMAGTATEQLVGLGLPVFTVPGQGPQFTPHFARLQKRLLGDSVVLCDDAMHVGERLLPLLQVAAQRLVRHRSAACVVFFSPR
jgi:uncharacterized protein (TIGR03492 family)